MKVNFTGMLGNQLFCYAFGRSLSLARNLPLYFDRRHVDSLSWYHMDAYNLNLKFDGPEGPLYQEKDLPFDSGVYTTPENSVFNGSWQTEKYFNAEVIRKELSKPLGEPNDSTKRAAETIDSEKSSVFIHVRRGDYLHPEKVGFHGCQGMDYYSKGMRYVAERIDFPKFFVFSDDPQWCLQNFDEKICTVMSYNRFDPKESGAQWDLWLMSLCKHSVMANSSFSWWGAWLREEKGKIVVSPKTWFLSKQYSSRDICPERWTQI